MEHFSWPTKTSCVGLFPLVQLEKECILKALTFMHHTPPSDLTVGVHVGLEAFCQPASGTPIPPRLVNETMASTSYESKITMSTIVFGLDPLLQ